MSQLNDNTTKRNCQHLNEAERKIIERQLQLGTSKKQIARLLGRNISTIRREIKRGSVPQRKAKAYISKRADDTGYTVHMQYFSDVGQRNYERNRIKCGAKSKITTCRDFVKYAETKILKYKWSPDAVVGEAKKKKLFSNIVSTVTLYNWIDQNLLNVHSMDLLQKVRRKLRTNHSTERKKKFGRSIDERPESVNNRTEFGHWEGDSIVGKNGNSSVLTLTERKTGHAYVLSTNGKCAVDTYHALKMLQERDPTLFSKIFRSITFDNGSEFAASELFESLGVTVYYAHPYSAWERGQNEHFNGMLRRFLPKGKDLSFFLQEDLDRFASFLNALPRKKLNYASPNDLFSKEVYAIISV